MNRRTRGALAIALLIVGLIVAAGWLLGELRVDRCLDAGGRWNAAGKRCEGARPGG